MCAQVGIDPAITAIEIGARDDLSPATAERRGKEWRDAADSHPEACFHLHISGYGEDPRALCDFPDVRAYMQRCAAAAGFRTMQDMPYVTPKTALFLATCGLFGPDIKSKIRIDAGITSVPAH